MEGGHNHSSEWWDDACSIRPKTRYHATAASVYTALLLWNLWKFPESFWITPWVFWNVTSHNSSPPATEKWSSASFKAIGHLFWVGRHCMWLVGQNFLQNSVLTATEDRQYMARNFQSNVCMVTLPIILWTQGSVALGTRATSHAYRCMMAKDTKLVNQCKCMQQNKWMPHALSCWDQGHRQPRIEMCFVTLSANTPHSSCLVWHPKPKTMLCMYAICNVK